MRVLITGAGGFAGSHVASLLAQQTEWELAVLDRPDRLPRSTDRLAACTFAQLPLIEVDLVMSLAATGDPAKALRDPVGAYVNNVRVMASTLEYARTVGARVLHVSTNEVNWSDGRYAPVGPYAGGKACQELICSAYPDVQTTVVVTQSLFGERQQPNKLVPTAIRSLIAGVPITLQRAGDRWAKRPFLHVRNLAEALMVLAGRPHAQGRVHVGATEALSVRDVVDVLADELRSDARVLEVPAGDRVGHEVDVVPIGCDVPDWAPSYPTSLALRDVACWYGLNLGWLE